MIGLAIFAGFLVGCGAISAACFDEPGFAAISLLGIGIWGAQILWMIIA